MITIIDYDAGNLKSVEKALQYLGQDVVITRDEEKIISSDKVILPGVGAFGDAMDKLEKYGLVNVIKEVQKKDIPLLGICLGLQLLFEESDEAPGREGLKLLPGKIRAIPKKTGFKIPHMGWNSININERCPLFKGIKNESYVYFVHSYYLEAGNENDVVATTDYIVNIHAAVQNNNIFACQFHPEKSGDVGLKILRNFCEL